MLDEVFKRDGFTTLLATRGLKALEIVQKEKIDVILLDVKLPFMNGLEVLKEIKKISLNIPVVMMSAYGESFLTKDVTDLGASYLVTKPFDIYEIRDIVSGFLLNEK